MFDSAHQSQLVAPGFTQLNAASPPSGGGLRLRMMSLFARSSSSLSPSTITRHGVRRGAGEITRSPSVSGIGESAASTSVASARCAAGTRKKQPAQSVRSASQSAAICPFSSMTAGMPTSVFSPIALRRERCRNGHSCEVL